MNYLSLLCCLLLFTQEVPFKSEDEFELKLEFQFRQRPPSDNNRFDYSQTHAEYIRANQGGPLPYLYAYLHLLEVQEDEARVFVMNNRDQTVVNKKLDNARVIKLDLGFTDDLKDHVSPYEYSILFLSKDKQVMRKIIMLFEEDGTYLVNGEERGKL